MMLRQLENINIQFAQENKIFNSDFHMFISNKTKSTIPLHEHNYYELVIVLTGRYYQIINDKKVLLERGNFVLIPLGSSHQSDYQYGATRVLNIGISQTFFENYYASLLPPYLIASQVYTIKNDFLTYIESAVSELNFQQNELTEFVETVTFHAVSRIRRFQEDEDTQNVPTWLLHTIEHMHQKSMFQGDALANMVALSGKTQAYLTRSTRLYFNKTPMQIIHEIRINAAKTQLELTNYSIADIAEDSGYSSPSLFIKNFNKIIKLTPKAYRKKCQTARNVNALIL